MIQQIEAKKRPGKRAESQPESRESRLARRQAMAAQMLHFAEHLSPPDRALMKGVYERGMAAHALARAMGFSSKLVQRRVLRLTRRVGSPVYRYVVRNRQDWPQERRAIAEAVLLRGQTQRATAATMGMSVHQVRRELDRIEMLREQAAEK